METLKDRYIREHSTPPCEALEWVEKQTHLRTNHAHMLSGAVQGRLLTTLVKLIGAKKVLEIGSFTGYSGICLSLGLDDDGHLDSLEINDELVDLIREGFKRAGVDRKTNLIIGDALDSLDKLEGPYDLVFIDADKREYLAYYEKILPLLRPGGCIVADDVLWDGKLLEKEVPQDRKTQGIASFNDFVVSDLRVEVVMLPLRDGLSIIRKK